MSQSTRIIRNFVALSGGEALGRLVSFIGFAYLARTLAPAGYGAVEIATALSMFFTIAVEMGTGAIGARDIAIKPENADDLVSDIFLTRAILACIAVPLMGWMGRFFADDPSGEQLVRLYALAILALPATYRWLFQGLERMPIVAFGQFLRTTVFVVGLFLMVHSTDDLVAVGRAEVAAATLLALFFVVARVRLTHGFRIRIRARGVGRIFARGWWLGLSQIVWALTQYVPTLILAVYLGTYAVGLYGAAHRVVLSLFALGWLYHFNLFPAVVRRMQTGSEDNFDALVRPSFRIVAWGGIGLATIGGLLAGIFCTTLYGNEFAAATIPLQLMLWTVPVHVVSGHARWVLIAADRQGFVLAAQSAGALATVVVGWPAILIFGASGAAATMLIASLVVWLVAHFFTVRRVRPLPFFGPFVRPLLVAAFSCASALLITDDPMLRGLIALVVYGFCALLVDRALIDHARTLLAALRTASSTGQETSPRIGNGG